LSGDFVSLIRLAGVFRTGYLERGNAMQRKKLFVLGTLLALVALACYLQVSAEDRNSSQSTHLYLPIVMDICGSGDNFDNPSSGWPTEAAASPYYGYRKNAQQDGKYYVIHLAPNRWVGLTRGDAWGDEHQRLQISAASVGDIGTNSQQEGVFGLLFGLNDDWTEFYSFELHQHHRRWRLFRYTSQVGFELLESDTISGLVGAGEAVNMTITVKVPGVVSLEIAGKTVMLMPEKSGRVGIVGASLNANDVELEYDDYVIGCETNDNRHAEPQVFETNRHRSEED
jgi:hypothetical protein